VCFSGGFAGVLRGAIPPIQIHHLLSHTSGLVTGTDRELLIEVGCEEIPASWLPGLTVQVGRHLDARLKEFRLTSEAAAEPYSTPRRLTASGCPVP